MNDQKFCQSCAMPMENEEVFGTNADGGKNEEYCVYCMKDGKFTMDGTMEDMINISVPHMLQVNPDMTEEQARSMCNEYFPQLKRWKA